MKRAVRAILRLVAAALVLFGGLTIGLEVVRHRMRSESVNLWQCLLGGCLIVLGIILIAFSSRLAEKLTDDFDE